MSEDNYWRQRTLERQAAMEAQAEQARVRRLAELEAALRAVLENERDVLGVGEDTVLEAALGLVTILRRIW